MPKVSVIVPVYGVEKYIERCARSLFEQTLDDIEYLFIDDCTPDRSIDILKKVMGDYPQRKEQVIIHRMALNSGQAKVREWGMKHAKGEYVIHCDSDDWVDKDMYLILYNRAIINNADIVRCCFDRVTDKYKIPCETIENHSEPEIKQLLSYLLLGKDLSSMCDKLVHRKLIEKLRFPKNNMWEDFFIVLQLLYYSERTILLPDILYHYYQNPQSICGKIDKDSAIIRYENECIALENVLEFLERNNILNEFNDEIANLKMHIKEELISFMFDSEVKIMWKSSFKDIGYSYLKNPTIRRNSKIKYLLCDCGLGGLLSIVKR